MKKLCLLFVALLGCESREKAEAKVLVAAMDAFHNGSNDDRPALAQKIDAAPCSAEDVCEAKQACLNATEPTARGLKLMHEVDVQMKIAEEHGDGGAAMKDLPPKLAQANDSLAQGHGAMPACSQKITRLRFKYGF